MKIGMLHMSVPSVQAK